MKLYFATYAAHKLLFEANSSFTNILDSYFSLKSTDLEKYLIKNKLLGKSFFLDSGAFSAFNLGAKIDIDAYIDYILKYKNYLTTYASLDVIGNAKATTANLLYMESKGLTPLPVFHAGTDFSVFERLLGKYDYIALGGLVPLRSSYQKLELFLKKCFGLVFEKYYRTGVLTKIHGFGLTNFNIWKRFPFFSADSSSWNVGGRLPYRYYFQNGVMSNKRKNYKDVSLANLQLHANVSSVLALNNAKAYLAAADFCTKVWEKRGITWGE